MNRKIKEITSKIIKNTKNKLLRTKQLYELRLKLLSLFCDRLEVDKEIQDELRKPNFDKVHDELKYMFCFGFHTYPQNFPRYNDEKLYFIKGEKLKWQRFQKR